MQLSFIFLFVLIFFSACGQPQLPSHSKEFAYYKQPPSFSKEMPFMSPRAIYFQKTLQKYINDEAIEPAILLDPVKDTRGRKISQEEFQKAKKNLKRITEEFHWGKKSYVQMVQMTKQSLTKPFFILQSLPEDIERGIILPKSTVRINGMDTDIERTVYFNILPTKELSFKDIERDFDSFISPTKWIKQRNLAISNDKKKVAELEVVLEKLQNSLRKQRDKLHENRQQNRTTSPLEASDSNLYQPLTVSQIDVDAQIDPNIKYMKQGIEKTKNQIVYYKKHIKKLQRKYGEKVIYQYKWAELGGFGKKTIITVGITDMKDYI